MNELLKLTIKGWDGLFASCYPLIEIRESMLQSSIGIIIIRWIIYSLGGGATFEVKTYKGMQWNLKE